MFSMSNFKKKLKAHRIRMGLTQTQLAEKANISSQTISAYESENDKDDYGGQKSKAPTLDKAINIANILGVSLDELCGDDNQPTQLKNFTNLVDYLNVLGEYFVCTIKSQELPLQTPPEYLRDDDNSDPVFKYETPGVVLEIQSGDLAKYIESRNKMLKLVKDNTISSDDYKSWRDSRKRAMEEKQLVKKFLGFRWQQDLVKESEESLLPESWLYSGEC